jgi:hypothetical protein
VQTERDIWILLQSVSPKEAAIWFADKRDVIGDPEFRAIYLEYDAAFDWSPDDPRLYALGPAHRDRQGAQGGRVNGVAPLACAGTTCAGRRWVTVQGSTQRLSTYVPSALKRWCRPE